MADSKKTVALIILDGWGYREEILNNAIKAAKTPVFDSLWSQYPHALLEASGLAVGLPEGQMGNSEIGHTTIGAGTVIPTDLVRIGEAIKNNTLAQNKVLVELFDFVKKNNSTLHIQGLLGDGGVHSHSEHLFAILRAAKQAGLTKVAIHVFTDGRDTPPQSAAKYLKELEALIAEVGVGRIASVSGRLYAMDRDNNWDRLAKVEEALFECKGMICTLKSPAVFLEELYGQGAVDEKLEPIIFTDETGEGIKIQSNDAVFFFNFRADRARMLSQKILAKACEHNIKFATMTEYDASFTCPVAFPSPVIVTTLAKEISQAGLTQAHIAETEKFPHATYFLNGGVEEPYPGEVHILAPSRKDVLTHDLAPEMRAKEIADHAITEINKGTDFIFINFANPDMVGHTANVPAIITAVETVDRELGRVLTALKQKEGVALITADHGNAEVNVDPETGERHTAHTINPVPAIVTKEVVVLNNGTLTDIAPTVLALLNLPKPRAMTGVNLIPN